LTISTLGLHHVIAYGADKKAEQHNFCALVFLMKINLNKNK
jgi:hypothetical protein